MKTNLQKAAFLVFCGTVIATSINLGGKHHNHCDECKIATRKGPDSKPESSIVSASYDSKPVFRSHK